MGIRRTDSEIHQLLARGGLGGPARDRILARILDRTGRPRRRTWVTAAAVGVACAAAFALWIRRSPGAGGFTAKGVAGRPSLDLACVNARIDACPVGGTLVFAAIGTATAGYIGAWAEPATPGPEVIWYFSAENDGAPVDTTLPLARRAIRVGPEHRPGSYVVHVLLSTVPLPHAALLAGSDPSITARASFPLTVTMP
jgi:hypothetical protein